jgi:hypothetical protein
VKKVIGVMLAVVLVIALTIAIMPASASQPSAKATAAVESVKCIGPKFQKNYWHDILSNDIKTANQKDLFVDVALCCGLYTDTTVKSKGGNKDTENAQATVKVRVVIDPPEEDWQGDTVDLIGKPGAVIFADRMQELSFTSQADPLGDSEMIQLILETWSANAFNFIFADIGQGTHTITVQGMIKTNTSSLDAKAWAAVGKGSVTIEEVRMIQNETIEMP